VSLETEVAAGRQPAAELDAAIEVALREVVAAQVSAGMGFVSDGHIRWADPAAALAAAIADEDTGPEGLLVRAWRATAAVAAEVGGSIAAAQALPGPYTLGKRLFAGSGEDRVEPTLRLAVTLARELVCLAAAGCPMAIIEEPAAVQIGDDPEERVLFAAAQERLLADAEALTDLHVMLAINGGAADGAGSETILAAPYRSYLFDLVNGPDNWRLVRAVPSERGIVCAALRVEATGGEDQLPILVWAAHYAASSNARGPDRIGLANATPLSTLVPAVGAAALATLGRATALAVLPLERAVEAGLDARTVDSRAAALGARAPKPPRPRGRRASS
jgi:hypothetical protein